MCKVAALVHFWHFIVADSRANCDCGGLRPLCAILTKGEVCEQGEDGDKADKGTRKGYAAP